MSGSPPASGGLVERERELDWLAQQVDRLVTDGDGGIAAIEGPAGIGKSRLLSETVELARSRGANVLFARGSELENQLAFGGVRQLLAAHIDALDPAGRTEVLRGPAAWAVPVLDNTAEPAQDLGDPLYGLASVSMNLAEERPLLIAVDDIQWLDEASTMFLAYLARRIEGHRILLLVIHRGEAGRPQDALPDLPAPVETLHPGPLSRTAVGELIETVLHSPASAALAEKCWRVTGGTPYLVEEVARAMVGLEPGARLRAVDEVGPTSIGRAVLKRIQRLPDTAALLAQAVALYPAGTSLADAAAVSGVDVHATALAADDLISAAVFAPGPRLAFLHPVMRTAVYQQLGAFGRRQGHARAADVLIARSADPEEVAAQLLAGEPSGKDDYVSILEAATDRAERSGALGAAVRYLARAVEEPPPAHRRGGLLRRLGRLQMAVAASEAEATLRRALDEFPGGTERIDVAVDLARASLANSHADDAVEVLLDVRDQAAHDSERSLLVDGLLAATAWESSRFPDVYQSVVEALPEDLPGRTPGERVALSQVAARLFDRCEPHERVTSILERLVADDGIGAGVEAAETVDVVHLLISCGALEEAESLCRGWQGQARSWGRDDLYLASQVARARILWFRGEIRECEGVVRLALELPDVSPAIQAILWLWLASICSAEGSYDEASRWLDLAAVHGAAFGMDVAISGRRGELALARDRPAEAVEPLEIARAGLERRGSTNPAESVWLVDLGEALARTGRQEEAEILLGAMLADAQRFGVARPIGLISLALGRVLRGTAALGHLTTAVEVLSSSPYRFDEARARLELGAALRRANRRTEARPHLRRALDFALRQRLHPLSARAHEELRAAGARPRRLLLSGIGALTPSEERIARLAASGMTNREIASHLFLTVKTVEMHLASTFTKLGIASRRELPEAFNAAGRTEPEFGSTRDRTSHPKSQGAPL
ncbi:MAG: AAA family ATPase [Actinomycetota bacterium]|nr:AAA family ATPase [Actinomycetota bacterium]